MSKYIGAKEVLKIKESGKTLKADYEDALEVFYLNQNWNDINGFLDVVKKANIYFNHWESFVTDSVLLDAHENTEWSNGLAEDCFETLSIVLKHKEFVNIFIEKSGKAIPSATGDTAYANMQRMVVKFIIKEKSQKMRDDFVKLSLPTYGFDYKYKNKNSLFEKTFLVVSLILLSLGLSLGMIIDNPTSFQKLLIWVTFSLGISGTSVEFGGKVYLKWSFAKRSAITACGSAAIFLTLYIFQPML